MLLADFIREATGRLEPLYPTREAHGIVLMLCASLLGTESYTHIVEPGFVIDPAKEPELASAMERLSSGEPIQYVLGWSEFCGRRFNVSPSVLIPRPETELLAMEAVRRASARPIRVLDLCTGSGNLAWTVALSAPGTEVVAVDISEEALSVARSQPFRSEAEASGARIPTFVKADVLDTEQNFPFGRFDLIVSNPPYIIETEKARMRRNVLDYEPHGALFVPEDDPLVFYRAIALWSKRLLSPGGTGMAEINEALGAETEAVFKAAGFPKTAQVKDFFEKTRFIHYSK